jgi:hypothetical protein
MAHAAVSFLDSCLRRNDERETLAASLSDLSICSENHLGWSAAKPSQAAVVPTYAGAAMLGSMDFWDCLKLRVGTHPEKLWRNVASRHENQNTPIFRK